MAPEEDLDVQPAPAPRPDVHPQLISAPFDHGLVVVFSFPLVLPSPTAEMSPIR
jgi:hypothetical protein